MESPFNPNTELGRFPHQFGPPMFPHPPTTQYPHQPRLMGSGLSLPPGIPGGFHGTLSSTLSYSLPLRHHSHIPLPRATSDGLPMASAAYMNPWAVCVLGSPMPHNRPGHFADLEWMAGNVPRGSSRSQRLRDAAKSLMLEMEVTNSQENTRASPRGAEASSPEDESAWVLQGERARKRVRGGHVEEEEEGSPRGDLKRAAETLLVQMQEELTGSGGNQRASEAALPTFPRASSSLSSRRRCLKTAATMLLQELERSRMDELERPHPRTSASFLSPIDERGGEQGEHRVLHSKPKAVAHHRERWGSVVGRELEYPPVPCGILNLGDRDLESCQRPATLTPRGPRSSCENPTRAVEASRKRKNCEGASQSMQKSSPWEKEDECPGAKGPWNPSTTGCKEDVREETIQMHRSSACSALSEQKPCWPVLFGVKLIPAVE